MSDSTGGMEQHGPSPGKYFCPMDVCMLEFSTGPVPGLESLREYITGIGVLVVVAVVDVRAVVVFVVLNLVLLLAFWIIDGELEDELEEGEELELSLVVEDVVVAIVDLPSRVSPATLPITIMIAITIAATIALPDAKLKELPRRPMRSPRYLLESFEIFNLEGKVCTKD